MFHRTLLVAIFAVVAILAVAAALPQTPIPSTPAGRPCKPGSRRSTAAIALWWTLTFTSTTRKTPPSA